MPPRRRRVGAAGAGYPRGPTEGRRLEPRRGRGRRLVGRAPRAAREARRDAHGATSRRRSRRRRRRGVPSGFEQFLWGTSVHGGRRRHRGRAPGRRDLDARANHVRKPARRRSRASAAARHAVQGAASRVARRAFKTEDKLIRRRFRVRFERRRWRFRFPRRPGGSRQPLRRAALVSAVRAPREGGAAPGFGARRRAGGRRGTVQLGRCG